MSIYRTKMCPVCPMVPKLDKNGNEEKDKNGNVKMAEEPECKK